MTKEFNSWKVQVLNKNRYEENTEIFEKLVDQVLNNPNINQVEALFDTFSNLDDYGIQDHVLLVLDKINDELFVDALVNKFNNLVVNSSEKEWPLLIIGRYVNSDCKSRIKLIKNRSLENKVLFEFLGSDFFLDEYPEYEDF